MALYKEENPIAIVYYACPICGKKDEDQSEIRIQKNLKDISEIHNKIADYGHPCDECKELKKLGIVVVEYNEEKSGDDFKDLYRTGKMFVIKEESVKRIFVGYPHVERILERRVTFVSDLVTKEMGFYGQ